MSRTLGFVSLTVLAFAYQGIGPSLAEACSAPYCQGSASLVLPSSGVVPSNFGALTIYGGAEAGTLPFATGAVVRFWDSADPSRVLFKGEQKISALTDLSSLELGVPLIQGHDYVAEISPQCSFDEQPRAARQFQFKAGPTAAVPTTLGPLSIVQTGRRQVPFGGGAGCVMGIPAGIVDMKIDLTIIPEAWRELVSNYQLIVDGEPFSWALTIGRFDGALGGGVPDGSGRGFYFERPQQFRAWTECTDTESIFVERQGLPAGKHTVWVRATVPDSDLTVIESEKLTIDVQCPAAGEEASETSGDAAGTGDEPAASVAGVEDPDGEARVRDDGCSVSPGSRAWSGAGWALIALCATLVRRRRFRAQ